MTLTTEAIRAIRVVAFANNIDVKKPKGFYQAAHIYQTQNN